MSNTESSQITRLFATSLVGAIAGAFVTWLVMSRSADQVPAVTPTVSQPPSAGHLVITPAASKPSLPVDESTEKDLVFPSARTFHHPFRINKVEDGFAEITTFELRADIKDTGLTLVLFDVVETKDPASMDSISFGFSSESTEWKFKTNHNLSVEIDGQRLALGESRYSGKVSSGGGVTEHVGLQLELDDFLKLIGAKKVDVKLGDTSLELTEEHLESMRDFASQFPSGTTVGGKFNVRHRVE